MFSSHWLPAVVWKLVNCCPNQESLIWVTVLEHSVVLFFVVVLFIFCISNWIIRYKIIRFQLALKNNKTKTVLLYTKILQFP